MMEGSTYLLFHQLPYSYDEELPLPLSNGVMLDITPSHLFKGGHKYYNDREFRVLVNFVLPGYGLPGIKINHCCLKNCADFKD
jgi:hypothetical protein